MVKMLGAWGDVVIAAGLIVSVCGAYLSFDHYGGGSSVPGRHA